MAISDSNLDEGTQEYNSSSIEPNEHGARQEPTKDAIDSTDHIDSDSSTFAYSVTSRGGETRRIHYQSSTVSSSYPPALKLVSTNRSMATTERSSGGTGRSSARLFPDFPVGLSDAFNDDIYSPRLTDRSGGTTTRTQHMRLDISDGIDSNNDKVATNVLGGVQDSEKNDHKLRRRPTAKISAMVEKFETTPPYADPMDFFNS